MAEKIKNRLHILTLVIKNRRDIPLVRSKAKHLGELCGMDRVDRVRLAVSASEMSRYMLEYSGGGTASFLLVCCNTECNTDKECAGIMLEFKGRHVSKQSDIKDCDGHGVPTIYTSPPIATRMPFAGINRAMDSVTIVSRGIRTPLNVEMIKWGIQKTWKELAESNEFLKKRLFRDAEESFVANLRAKHEEVLKLLEELSRKNRELDKANSELMQLSNDLETLTHERTMSEIALKVADRIRNPATAIGGLARVLLKKTPKDEGIRKKLEAIFYEAMRLEKIVKDFDSLANVKGRAFKKTDLRNIVNSVIDTLTPSFEQKNITTRIKMTDDPVIALINPQTIKVALLHILRNAIEASARSGIIEVSVWRRDGQPFISIRDFGPGIDSEVMDKLFRTSVTTKATGTGMGLITVKQIMDEHKGSIEIKSGKDHGPGTEVILLFPVRWKEFDS